MNIISEVASKGHSERIMSLLLSSLDNSSTEMKRERSSHLRLICLTALGLKDGEDSSQELYSHTPSLYF